MSVVIQLTDKSIIYLESILKDVIVQVDELVFPTNFYIIDMKDDKFNIIFDISLGRPFFSTAKSKIDVHDG